MMPNDPAENEPPPFARGRQKTGVLVVDDEPGVRKLLELVLREQGFDVWAAANGKEAIECCWRKDNDVDLVLLDVRMPDLDGPQVLANLRKLNPQIQACFMTGWSGSYTEEQLLKLGAVCILKKPFGMRELVQALRKMIDIPSSGPDCSYLLSVNELLARLVAS